MPTGVPDRAGLQLTTRRERKSSFVNYPTKTAGAIPRSAGPRYQAAGRYHVRANGGISRGEGAKKRGKTNVARFPVSFADSSLRKSYPLRLVQQNISPQFMQNF